MNNSRAPMTPIDHLSRIFGSQRALARAIGVDESLTRQWQRRNSVNRKAGRIPPRYNQAVMQAARAIGKAGKARQYLDMYRCPKCGMDFVTMSGDGE